MPKTDLSGAIYIANQIQIAIKHLNIAHPSSSVSNLVTLSLGVGCTIPPAKTNPKVLIHATDMALYTAKNNGRNCIVSQHL